MSKRNGISIAEILIAVVIISIIGTGGLFFNNQLRWNISQLLNRFNAIKLAIAEIEDLKNKAVSDFDTAGGPLEAGANKSHTLDQAGFSLSQYYNNGFSVTYDIVDNDWPAQAGLNGDGIIDCKIVVVNVSYPSQLSTQRNTLKFAGFIVRGAL